MGKKENRSFTDFNEVYEFFYRSWVYGFKHLGWLVSRDKGRTRINL
jgi:hypothetical protein